MRSMSWRAVGGAFLYLTMAHSSQAQTFYKCMSAQGQAEFLEQPCSGSPADRVESLSCQKARRELDAAANSAKSGRHDLPARRAAMYSACSLKPPHVTIINNQAPAAPR